MHFPPSHLKKDFLEKTKYLKGLYWKKIEVNTNQIFQILDHAPLGMKQNSKKQNNFNYKEKSGFCNKTTCIQLKLSYDSMLQNSWWNLGLYSVLVMLLKEAGSLF